MKQSPSKKRPLTNSARNIQTMLRISALAFGVLAFLAESAHGRAQVPEGVFSIANVGLPPQDEVLADPNVDGVSIRFDWANLEPTEGVFDFSYLDTTVASCAAARKKVLLRIGTQSGKPAWVTTAVKNAGGLFFHFVSDGKNTSIPVFWDPTFLEKKTAMIAALGAHFTANPTVVIVVASFANASSEDWNVPHTTQYVTQWQNLGYTSDKLVGAGHTIIDATMTAFPNQFVTLAVSSNGTKLDQPNPDPADYVATTVVNDERDLWPGRLIAQKNDLSTFIPAYPGTKTIYEMMTEFAPNVGGQMLFQCVNDPTYKVNRGIPIDPALALTLSINNALSYSEKYVEIYQVDVVNLPDIIEAAHIALTSQ